MLTSAGGLSSLLDPQHLLDGIGPWALLVVCLVVVAETGLFVVFLPGDSLLFTAGLLVAGGEMGAPLWLVCLATAVAAATGDQIGYLIGRTLGPRLFTREDGRLFRRSHLRKTEEFFERYGARTVLLARFVPAVRTLAPVAAGGSRMHYRTFVSWNLVGAVGWGVGVTLLGYFLGQVAVVREHLEVFILGVVALSLVPAGVEVLRERRKRATVQP